MHVLAVVNERAKLLLDVGEEHLLRPHEPFCFRHVDEVLLTKLVAYLGRELDLSRGHVAEGLKCVLRVAGWISSKNGDNGGCCCRGRNERSEERTGPWRTIDKRFTRTHVGDCVGGGQGVGGGGGCDGGEAGSAGSDGGCGGCSGSQRGCGAGSCLLPVDRPTGGRHKLQLSVAVVRISVLRVHVDHEVLERELTHFGRIRPVGNHVLQRVEIGVVAHAEAKQQFPLFASHAWSRPANHIEAKGTKLGQRKVVCASARASAATAATANAAAAAATATAAATVAATAPALSQAIVATMCGQQPFGCKAAPNRNVVERSPLRLFEHRA
eukprot:3980666-Pleurochrysis_carterae.AAC.1